MIRVWHPSGLFAQAIPADDVATWLDAGWVDHNPRNVPMSPPAVEGSPIRKQSRKKEKK